MTQLARRLTLTDAVVLGLGSMIGAGVFAVFGPAAAAAGPGLFLGLGLAALVAFCNATSSAQLAAAHPTSGGTYVYGREELNDWWGFLAGWGFVIGKTASAGAMALTFAAHIAPEGPWQRAVAVTAVVALAAVNYHGITRTARLTRIIIAVTGTILVAVIAANLASWTPHALQGVAATASTPLGVLQSAGLLFFAFAGYARIATLGEEVVDPRRTIPRAILIALGTTVLLYTLVALSVTGVLGVDAVAASTAPLADAVAAGSASWLTPAVRIGGAVASLGALLALFAGIGRTALAMARNGDLPRPLAAVHPRYRVPHRAEVAVATAVSALVLVVDLRGMIGFSSFGVLLYYTVANVAAHRQPVGRLYPRQLQTLGAALCLLLVVTLPWHSVAAGLVMYLIGVGYRLVVQRRRSSPGPSPGPSSPSSST